jgi:hypothetical protein
MATPTESSSPLVVAVAPLTGRLAEFAQALGIQPDDLESQNTFSGFVHRVVNDSQFGSCVEVLPNAAFCFNVRVVEVIQRMVERRARESLNRASPNYDTVGPSAAHLVAYAATAVADIFLRIIEEWPEDGPQPDLWWFPPAPNRVAACDFFCLTILIWWYVQRSETPVPEAEERFEDVLWLLVALRYEATVGWTYEDFIAIGGKP